MRKTPAHRNKSKFLLISAVSKHSSASATLTPAVIVGHVREFPDVSQPDSKADHGEHVLYPVGPMRALRSGVAIITACFLFRKDPKQAQLLLPNGFIWLRTWTKWDYRAALLLINCLDSGTCSGAFCADWRDLAVVTVNRC